MKSFSKRSLILTVALITGITAVSACSSTKDSTGSARPAGGTGTEKANANANAKPANANTVSEPVVANKNTNQNTETATGKCTLTKAPEIYGFELGQTVEEIDRRFSGFKGAYDDEKAAGLDNKSNKANFVLVTSGNRGLEKSDMQGGDYKDISFIWHFLDGKLIGLVVKDLSDATADLSVKEYISKVSKDYALPKDGWKLGKEDDADLSCPTFDALLTAGGQPGMSVMIFDKKGEAEKKNRGL